MPEPIISPEALAQAMTDEQLAEQAGGIVRDYCGWHISPSRTETITVDGPAGPVLTLPTLHVTDVAAVTVDGREVTGYRWATRGQVYGIGWGEGPRRVAVNLTHGYDEPPAAVVSVIAAIVTRTKATKWGLAVRAQAGQVSRTYSQAGPNQAAGMTLLDHERQMLDKYRVDATP